MILIPYVLAATLIIGLLTAWDRWKWVHLEILRRQHDRQLMGKNRYYTSMEEAQHRPRIYMVLEWADTERGREPVRRMLTRAESEIVANKLRMPPGFLNCPDQRNVRSSKQVFAEIDDEIRSHPELMMEFLATDPGYAQVLEVEWNKAAAKKVDGMLNDIRKKIDSEMGITPEQLGLPPREPTE